MARFKFIAGGEVFQPSLAWSIRRDAVTVRQDEEAAVSKTIIVDG